MIQIRRPAHLALTLALSAAPLPVLAQALQNPGTATIEAHVVKAAPLEATPERIAALKLPAGFRIEAFARDLGAPRVIVVSPTGRSMSATAMPARSPGSTRPTRQSGRSS